LVPGFHGLALGRPWSLLIRDSRVIPAVIRRLAINYDYPMGALIGMVTQVNAQYNFTDREVR
jgi:hypothetical protein